MNATTQAEVEVLEAPPTPAQAVAVLRDSALAELNAVDAGIAALRESYAGKTYAVATTQGLEEAKKARADIRERRYKVPHIIKAKKAELKQIGEAIDTEGDRIIAALQEIETPIDAQIKAEEDRKAAEKARREQEEREAAVLVATRIDGIRGFLMSAVGVSPEAIAALISELEGMEITLPGYGDRAGEAIQLKAQTLDKLGELHAAGVADAQAKAKFEEERAELARQRAEQEAREKADRERIAAEQKAAADKLAAERAKFEQEQATARAEAKAREDADRARRDEEDRLARETRAAEDKRIADARAQALEAEQRAVREAAEAKEADERKATQEAKDAAAAAERQRLDDEAATRRAEEQRIADEARAEHQRKGEERERVEAAKLRIRDAAPVLLDALKAAKHMLMRDPIDDAKMAVIDQCDAAITEATGEET